MNLIIHQIQESQKQKADKVDGGAAAGPAASQHQPGEPVCQCAWTAASPGVPAPTFQAQQNNNTLQAPHKMFLVTNPN